MEGVWSTAFNSVSQTANEMSCGKVQRRRAMTLPGEVMSAQGRIAAFRASGRLRTRAPDNLIGRHSAHSQHSTRSVASGPWLRSLPLTANFGPLTARTRVLKAAVLILKPLLHRILC